MTEPVLLFAFDVIHKLIVPITDEDVARGTLEHGWVPTHTSQYDRGAFVPEDVPTGTLTFFMFTWRLRRVGERWCAPSHRGFITRMMKIRMPIDEDEELSLEPIDIVDPPVGTVVLDREHNVGYRLGVFCDEDARYLAISDLIGGRGPYVPVSTASTATYMLCKQPAAPFVLK